MKNTFDTVRKTRTFLLDVVADLSIEQLNTIPKGFNNNIIWNFGHMIAAQQGICYKRPGLELRVSEDFFNAYRPGSRPTSFISSEDWEEIKDLLFATINIIEEDYNSGLYTSYEEWTSRYNVTISSIDDALLFLPFHEGLHGGIITALSRLV